jgi:cellobiose-specific phosphotransferase system component IIB
VLAAIFKWQQVLAVVVTLLLDHLWCISTNCLVKRHHRRAQESADDKTILAKSKYEIQNVLKTYDMMF